MKKDRQYTLREVIKQYYSGEDIYEQYADEAEELLKQIDPEQIKEECMKKSQERSGKIWRIGKLAVNRAACIVAGVCIITVLCGFGYAVASGYIKGIKVEDKEDHSELEIKYYEENNWDVIPQKLNKIKEFHEPAWIPEGFCKDSEFKTEVSYRIVFKEINTNQRIIYHQILPSLKTHYSTEGGIHEKITLDKYTGEYIETEKENFLIVTDGIYVYDVIGKINKDALLKIVESINE